MSTAATEVAAVDDVDKVDSYSKRVLVSARTWVSTPSTVSLLSAPSDVDRDLMRAAILPTIDLLIPRIPAMSR